MDVHLLLLPPHNTSITQSLRPPHSDFAHHIFRLSSRSSARFSPRTHSSSTSHSHVSFIGRLKPFTLSVRCHPNSGTPSPKSDGEDIVPVLGIDETLSKFQHRTQIFFAVLFWMSLFFWACATDGNNDGGSSKRSGFRR
ncbi:hypothetical protein C5167_018855 [Papaver somniferum]|uniref:Uncharacterized protein n=1 Tax=Papaver somniferum TaxID=3469 RepID=A0A4Y7IP36_PAPSO|nr:uncharacterized protein LOC113348359 [Papaver somniferum]RZC50437.1 hypothetical protein C5167_018855 [Papaver somniferum]